MSRGSRPSRAVRASTSSAAAAHAGPSTRHRPEPERARGRARITPLAALAALILAAGTWAYATSFAGVLVLDDVRAIARNPTIRTLWPVSVPLSPPSEATVSGRPLANLSFAVNYAAAPADAREVFDATDRAAGPNAGALFLRNIRGYHLANLLIHLASALVLFGVVRRTLLTHRLRPRFGTAAPWMACAVALVWVVHPLQTAAVTYVVQRVESLMALFYLLTLYCAIRASGEAEPHQARWTIAAIVSGACGMATKEVMVTAPIVVALWDFLFNAGREVRQRRTLLAGLAATWILLGVLVEGERRGPSVDLQPAMIWQYLTTQAEVLVHYLRLVFVPRPLAFLYDWPLAASLRDVIPQALLVTGLLVSTLVLIARRHPAGFLGGWFFLVLAPSSSVLPVVTEVAAEHRMYLPLAAVVVAVATGIVLAGQRWLRRGAADDRPTAGASTVGPVQIGAALLTLAIVVVLGVETRARNAVYASEVDLWGDNVAARPDDPRPRVAYGSALARVNRFAEAESQLQVAVTQAPNDPVARVRLGSVLASQNKLDAAIPHLEHTLMLRPEDVDAHRFLGEIYATRRQDAAGRVALRARACGVSRRSDDGRAPGVDPRRFARSHRA